MKRPLGVLLLLLLVLAGPIARGQPAAAGRISGHVRLSGAPPGNPIIRMGMDPRCAQATRGKRVVQETVLTSADGGLANTFVYLAGAFPQAPPPAAVVTIDQQSCIYRPRVVGARVGQTIEFRNGDQTLHNVHSLSAAANAFNIGQPVKGQVFTFRLQSEEVMLRIKCDVHRWMAAYVGVVDHPYFAVSGDGGLFSIDAVPAGHHTIRAWHERYGLLTRTIDVAGGETASADFTYSGGKKPDR